MDEKASLRKLLWLNHGHYGLYGDDGEMQCGICMLDYKKDPIEKIVKRFDDMSFDRIVEHMKEAHEKAHRD